MKSFFLRKFQWSWIKSRQCEAPFQCGIQRCVSFNKKVKVLFPGISIAQRQRTKTLSNRLTVAGIKHTYYEWPGTAHESHTWKPYLTQFAPLLFK